MINDRLIVLPQHRKKARKILRNCKINKKSIILIGGSSGVGKSEVADCLQELLFKKKLYSLSLSLDDFYVTHPIIRNYNRKKMGLDSVGLSEIDWESLCRICEDFKNNKPIAFRRTHKYADIIEHNIVESQDVHILLIEGLYVNYLRKYNYGDISLYLEGNPEQTFEFRKKRGKEDEDDTFRQKVVQREFNIVCQLKRHADVILEFGNN